MKIAFIGTGNRVRSLMAESVAKRLIREALLSADIYSAGVEPQGETLPQVLEVLQEKGYPTEGLRPKSLKDIPFEELDLVVVVCSEAKDKVPFHLSHKRRENWNLELPPEPSKLSLKRVLEDIERNIRELFKLT